MFDKTFTTKIFCLQVVIVVFLFFSIILMLDRLLDEQDGAYFLAVGGATA